VDAPFAPAEVEALLGDADVAFLGEACVVALREGATSPLLAALEALGPGGKGDGVLRKASFAAAIQGLAPRLARLPGAAALPAPLAGRLALEAERTAERGRRILATLGEVLALLEAAGAAAIPLKGAALLLRGEAEPGLRPMGDLDLLLVEPGSLPDAAHALAAATPYRPLLDTPRHLVLAQQGERVAAPGGEHPENPLRIELHRSFRLPVLGVRLDATGELRRDAERAAGGARVPSPAAMGRHLWHHAAEDFAAKGLRGVQALDFHDRARRLGSLPAEPPPEDESAAAPLLYAADAVERLFPGTFEPASLARLASRVPAERRRRAAALPALRHARSARGFSRTALALAPSRLARARFLLRTAFPTRGEVKANVAPEAEGLALTGAWVKVLLRRAGALLHGPHA